MTENTLAVVVLAAFLVIVGGVIAWALFRKKRKITYSYPATWTHMGNPPVNVERALAVIKECLPGWTGNYGGTIEWVEGPFMAGPIKAAGAVMDFNTPRIKLMYFADVSQCALAHEIKHLYERVYDNDKILDGDPALYAWVNETNAKIRAAMV